MKRLWFLWLLLATTLNSGSAEKAVTLMVNTNGVLLAPTNFWNANSNAISAVVGAVCGVATNAIANNDGVGTNTTLWGTLTMMGDISGAGSVTANEMSSTGPIHTTDQFDGNGTGLTNLNASNLASGTLPDARLSSNVPLEDAANVFTGSNTFSGRIFVSGGLDSRDGAADSVLIGGGGASAAGDQSVAIGLSANANTNNAISIGSDSAVDAYGGIAIGNASTIGTAGHEAIAIGNGATAEHTNSIAIGAGAQTSANNQIVMGTGQSIVGNGAGLTNIPQAGVTDLVNSLTYLTNNLGGGSGLPGTNTIVAYTTEGATNLVHVGPNGLTWSNTTTTEAVQAQQVGNTLVFNSSEDPFPVPVVISSAEIVGYGIRAANGFTGNGASITNLPILGLVGSLGNLETVVGTDIMSATENDTSGEIFDRVGDEIGATGVLMRFNTTGLSTNDIVRWDGYDFVGDTDAGTPVVAGTNGIVVTTVSGINYVHFDGEPDHLSVTDLSATSLTVDNFYTGETNAVLLATDGDGKLIVGSGAGGTNFDSIILTNTIYAPGGDARFTVTDQATILGIGNWNAVQANTNTGTLSMLTADSYGFEIVNSSGAITVTGDITLPATAVGTTQSAGDNDTSVATTAFVTRAITNLPNLTVTNATVLQGGLTATNPVLWNAAGTKYMTNDANGFGIGMAPSSSTYPLSVAGGIQGDSMNASILLATSSGYHGWANRAYIYSPNSGTLAFVKEGEGFNLLILGEGRTAATQYASTNWPALRVESSTNNVTLGIRKGTNTMEFANLQANSIQSSNYQTGATVTITNGNISASGTLALGTLTATQANFTEVNATNLVVSGTTVASLGTATAGKMAYATDVLTPRGSGGFVYADGTDWRTWQNHIIATANLTNYMLNVSKVGLDISTPRTKASWVGIGGAISYGVLRDLYTGTTGTGAAAAITYGNPTHYGTFLSLATGTTTTGYAYGRNSLSGYLSNDVISASSRLVGVETNGGNTFWVLSGMPSAPAPTYPSGGSFFLYDPVNTTGDSAAGSGNWLCVTRNSSTSTVTDSGLPCNSTTDVTLTVVQSSESVYFYTNNSVAAIHTANIYHPGALYPINQIVKTAGTTSKIIYLEYVGTHIRYATAKY